jgi:5-carboxymethyl-2-hydroxymuconic-semialdehyde dehydrogenase
MAAKTSVGITAEFIEQIRSTLSQTTLKHYICGRGTPGIRGAMFDTLDPSSNQILAHV